MTWARAHIIALAGGAALAACASGQGDGPLGPPARAEYLGVDTRLLDARTVSFKVRMRGARGARDVVAYARCAAAQYALIRGYNFAQHVRTTTARVGDVWEADGGYVISPDIPAGLRNVDAEVVVADCQEQGIPTV